MKQTYLENDMYVCLGNIHTFRGLVSIWQAETTYVGMYVCLGKHTYLENSRYVCMSGETYIPRNQRYVCMSKVCMSGETYIPGK